MLLKRLTLHGFKTFASRTAFEFQGGITAVIGPNGSGKSNLADAVRWVLGETSQSTLRSKKTEDVIFAGSSGRPVMGMAEVSLTIDNSSGLLASEFVEITITRRAYRDGENQYLINGQRVRLRDLIELLTPLGSAYTVIGQGLVDAALSLRPEERRSLFEQAANIAGFQHKRSEAERQLAAAEGNCQRLTDILAELAPRVHGLERQARQASEAATIQSQLQTALRGWYGAQWQVGQARVTAATAAATDQCRRLADVQATTAALNEQRARLRERLANLRSEQAAQRQQRSTVQEQVASAHRQLAVANERVAALERQLATSDDDADDITERTDAVTANLTEVTAALAEVEAAVQEATADRQSASRSAAAAEHEVRQAEQTMAQLRQALLAGATRIGRQESELARLHERQAALERERRGLIEAVDHQQAQRRLLAERATTLEAETAAADIQRQDLAAQQAATSRLITALDAALEQQRQQRDRLDHELTTTGARLEALERLRESGAGLAAGARAVLAAVRANRLQGILGAVVSLVSAPAHLETALEVALGGHIHDIVVERWTDAEAAIAFLKQAGSGRATFQPLDTLRPGRPLATETAAGVIGPAVRLVEYAARFKPVVEAVLGRVLVVEDLTAAQPLIRRGTAWTLVTVTGEIARPGGAVTGGAAVREAGLLARERELRELPGRVASLRQSRATATAALEARQAERAERAEQATRLTGLIAGLVREADQRTHLQARLTAERAALAQSTARSERQRAEIDEQLRQMAAEIERQTGALVAAETSQTERQATLEGLLQRQTTLLQQQAATTSTVSAARDRLGRLDEQRRAWQRRQQELQAERSRLAAAERTRAERRAAMQAALVAAQADQERHGDDHRCLSAALEHSQAQAASLEATLTAAVSQDEALSGRLDDATSAQLAAEAEAGRANVAAAQAGGELTALAARIGVDLPEVEPADLVAEADADPRLTARVTTLRERLRRIGLVDPAVIDEHREASERQAFLTRELADVESAIATLRAAIAALDRLMRQRFAETFTAVNVAFGESFTRLFSGGSARLELINDGDLPGVDIIAHPPGKRPQGLALLSGGERALTAAALLFALLKVNPTPFCLLDEVDAALDETNVTRFQGLLADLAVRTQFVVITHNRATIEGADTLYGITMGQDGVSQVISLRLTQPSAPRTTEVEAIVAAGVPQP